jgi:seryl-tRNA synthetase
MFDLKWIRENPDAFDAGLKRRNAEPLSARILELDTERRAAQTSLQEYQTRRNEASKLIGKAKGSGDEETAQALMAEVADLKDKLKANEDREREVGKTLHDILSSTPNLPAADVPDGDDEDANIEIRRVGEPPELGFEAKQHFEIGEDLGQMDFETAARVSGARFVYMSGGLARMERALGAFMLDLHTGEHGYTEVNPPVLVRSEALYGTGQLPKFAEDQFHTDDDFWLIPTAEVPLTNLVSDQILSEDYLPRRYTAQTMCFRSEAGSAGRDTRGLIRVHQFTKVEMVSVVKPDQSDAELDRMTACAEEVLKRLGLAYRVVVLCTGDMGFGAQKTHDIEVWLPGQDTYREISSCSNCGDFQARRMKARFKVEGEKGTQFVHTLNGSGLAVGRTLVAILENYQQADGSVIVPEVLRPYMGGMEVIEANG